VLQIQSKIDFWMEYNRICSLSCEIFVSQTYFEDATKANTASTHHYSVVTVRRTRCTVSATETAVTTTRRPNTTSRTSLYDCLHEERIRTRLTCFALIGCVRLKLGRLCRRVLENPVLVTPERTTMDAVKGVFTTATRLNSISAWVASYRNVHRLGSVELCRYKRY